jgi:hypothetical protein
MVTNIRKTGRLHSLADVNALTSLAEERRRFNIVSDIFAAMSGR